MIYQSFILFVYLLFPAICVAKSFPSDLSVAKVQEALKTIFPGGVPKKLPVHGIIMLPEIPGRPQPYPFKLAPGSVDIGPALQSLNTGKTISSHPNDGMKFKNEFRKEAPKLKAAEMKVVPIDDFHLREFRVEASGGGTNRLLLDINNKKLFFTSDHYTHAVPYSPEFENFFPMKEYIDTFNKNFVREMQADVDVIEMKSYQKVVFREFQNAEAKFVTQFKNRMTPEELTAWKSNPTYSEISESYMHYWEKRANPLDAASFAKRVEELGLPKEQVTFATHDGFIVETKTGNTYIHFFEKKGTNAPRYIIQQTASKKMKRISFVRDSNTGAVKLEMKKLEIQAAPAPAPAPEKNAPAAEPAQPAVEPCRRRLSRRQGAGCIRNKAEFKPNIEDPKSVRFEVTAGEAEVAVARLEQTAAGRALNAAVKTWKIAKPFVETGAKVLEGGLIVGLVAFDTYNIVEACKSSENRDIRDCMTNVVIMALDIASTVGCGIVGGPGLAVVCGVVASILTGPFAASMVAIGEGLGQAFKDLYNSWKQGKIMEGFKLVLGDMQHVKEQIISKFEPLANHILNGVRKATTFIGKVINRLNGFLGGDGFEGETSSYDLIMPAQVRENLQAAGFRYISVTQHCQRAFVKTTKRAELMELGNAGLYRFKTDRCDYIQNVNSVDITVYKENNPNAGMECQNGIAIQGEDRKVRIAPLILQLVGWRPVVHWSHTIDTCKNVPIVASKPIPSPAIPTPTGPVKEILWPFPIDGEKEIPPPIRIVT